MDRYKQLYDELMNGKGHVSHSQLQKYSICPKKWWYYMVARLRTNRIEEVVGRRTLGKLIHMGLELSIRKKVCVSEYANNIKWCTDKLMSRNLDQMYADWLDNTIKEYTMTTPEGIMVKGAVLDEEMILLNELIFQAKSIVPRVIRELNLDNAPWETVLDHDGEPIIEYELYSTLPNGVKVLSYVDWLIRDLSTGKYIVVDFKTTSRKKANYDMDIQVSAIYNMALQQNGIISEHGEAMIVEIDAKELKRPNLNKDGTMSKAQIHTTWDIYKEDLIANDLNPDDYLDMRRKLMNVKFTSIHHIMRTAYEANAIWQNRSIYTDRLLHDLQTADPSKFIANLGGMHCAMCEYRDACNEDVAGYGFQDLVDSGIYKIAEFEDEDEIVEVDDDKQ